MIFELTDQTTTANSLCSSSENNSRIRLKIRHSAVQVLLILCVQQIKILVFKFTFHDTICLSEIIAKGEKVFRKKFRNYKSTK